jgi:putative membrane protein
LINAKLSMLLAASVMAVANAACSGPENTASQAVPAETPMAAPAETAAVDSGTTDFVEKAVNSNMFEIEASKIALERSKVQPVKDFAKMLVDAHTTALGELQSLSTAAIVTAPTAMNNDFMGKLEALRNAKVEDFDDVYIDQQTEAHENSLNLVKGYSENGKDAGLRAFAAKMITTVDAHLTTVRALDKSPADDITKSPS